MSSINESRIIIEMVIHGKWSDSWAEHIDFDKFIKIATESKVLSTLSQFIFDRKIEKHFKGTGAYKILLESLLLNKRDLIAYKRVLTLLKNEFSKIDIDLCLLKGISLSGKYPRDMGDLDILIREEDLCKAIELLEELGFQYQGFIRNDLIGKKESRDWEKLLQWNNQFQFLDPLNDVLVELHTNFFESRRVYPFSLDPLLQVIDEFWERSLWSEDLQCLVLSPEDRLWLLSMHNSINRSVTRKSFILRHILDMANLINREELDWNYLFESSRKADCLVFIVYSLEMVDFFIPGTVSHKIIDRGNLLLRSPKQVLKKIMIRCYIDPLNVSYVYMFLFKLILPFVQKSRITQKIRSLFILPVLFPTRRRLRQIYGLSKSSGLVLFVYILEPIRWVLLAYKILKDRTPVLKKIKDNDGAQRKSAS